MFRQQNKRGDTRHPMRQLSGENPQLEGLSWADTLAGYRFEQGRLSWRGLSWHLQAHGGLEADEEGPRNAAARPKKSYPQGSTWGRLGGGIGLPTRRPRGGECDGVIAVRVRQVQ